MGKFILGVAFVACFGRRVGNASGAARAKARLGYRVNLSVEPLGTHR